MLAALEEIRVRKLQEGGQNVGVRHSQWRQMAVRIEFRGDDRLGSDKQPNAGKQVALAIVIALRDHRAVQSKDNAVDRQRSLQLIEYLVAKLFVGLALDQPAGLGPGRSSFNELKALFASPPAKHNHRRGAKRRRIRMFPRWRIESEAKTRQVGRHR